MNRDKIKEILGENVSEEQISSLLNSFHSAEKVSNDKLNSLQKQLNSYSDYNDIKNKYGEAKAKLDKLETEQLTEQERLQKMIQEAEKNLAESKITKNKAQVMTVLSGLDIDEEIIDSIVSEDETKSLNLANKILNKINSTKETIEKQTKENLVNLDKTPNLTNMNPNKEVMTFDKFGDLSADEQEKFINEHPEEFKNL